MQYDNYNLTSSIAESFIFAMLSSDRDVTYAWAFTAQDIAVGSIGVFRKEKVHRLTGNKSCILMQTMQIAPCIFTRVYVIVRTYPKGDCVHV